MIMLLHVDFWNNQTNFHEKCECYDLLIVTVNTDVACCKHRGMQDFKIVVPIWQHLVLPVSTRRRICGNRNMKLVTYSCCFS
jgi:hypothetical protein